MALSEHRVNRDRSVTDDWPDTISVGIDSLGLPKRELLRSLLAVFIHLYSIREIEAEVDSPSSRIQNRSVQHWVTYDVSLCTQTLKVATLSLGNKR